MRGRKQLPVLTVNMPVMLQLALREGTKTMMSCISLIVAGLQLALREGTKTFQVTLLLPYRTLQLALREGTKTLVRLL